MPRRRRREAQDDDCEPLDSEVDLEAEYAAYHAGRAAFAANAALDDCPFAYGCERKHWMTGWLDAQSARKFPHLFIPPLQHPPGGIDLRRLAGTIVVCSSLRDAAAVGGDMA
jgi:ribosome modulation factor